MEAADARRGELDRGHGAPRLEPGHGHPRLGELRHRRAVALAPFLEEAVLGQAAVELRDVLDEALLLEEADEAGDALRGVAGEGGGDGVGVAGAVEQGDDLGDEDADVLAVELERAEVRAKHDAGLRGGDARGRTEPDFLHEASIMDPAGRTSRIPRIVAGYEPAHGVQQTLPVEHGVQFVQAAHLNEAPWAHRRHCAVGPHEHCGCGPPQEHCGCGPHEHCAHSWTHCAHGVHCCVQRTHSW